jgi:hypothetical protein
MDHRSEIEYLHNSGVGTDDVAAVTGAPVQAVRCWLDEGIEIPSEQIGCGAQSRRSMSVLRCMRLPTAIRRQLAGIQVLSLAVWGDGCAAEAARDPSVECDINWWPLLIAIYVPIEAAFIALGVGLRKSGDTLRRRRVRMEDAPA